MDVLLIIMETVLLLTAICIAFVIIMDVLNTIKFNKKAKTKNEILEEMSESDMTFGAILRSDLRMTDKDIGIIRDGEIVYPNKTDIYTQVDEIRNIVSVNVKCEFDYDEVFDLMTR